MTRPRRRRGTGTVNEMADGTFRARMPGDGPRLSPRTTYEEAEALLDAAIAELNSGGVVSPGGTSLRSFGITFLDDRELAGIADVGSDRSRWNQHVTDAYFIDWPLGSIAPHDGREWLACVVRKNVAKGRGHKVAPRRKLSRVTVQNTLNLLRCCFTAAIWAGHIESNPLKDVSLPEGPGRTHEPWTYLTMKEQESLLGCKAIPERDRLLIAFAIGTGLRQGEVWNLELRDVSIQESRIVVRYGSRGRSTKGKRIRYVPLFGMARDSLEKWLPMLRRQKNPHRLVWPLQSGARRQKGKAPNGWEKYLAAAKIVAAKRHDSQPVRWHDLRHTCASSLVSGWWGRRWSLEEVQKLLGHRSRVTTERYAHLAEGVLELAAQETDNATITPPFNSSKVRKTLAPPRRLERPTNGLGNRSTTESSAELDHCRSVILESSREAAAALEVLGSDKNRGWREAIRVLGLVAARGVEALPVVDVETEVG